MLCRSTTHRQHPVFFECDRSREVGCVKSDKSKQHTYVDRVLPFDRIIKVYETPIDPFSTAILDITTIYDMRPCGDVFFRDCRVSSEWYRWIPTIGGGILTYCVQQLSVDYFPNLCLICVAPLDWPIPIVTFRRVFTICSVDTGRICLTAPRNVILVVVPSVICMVCFWVIVVKITFIFIKLSCLVWVTAQPHQVVFHFIDRSLDSERLSTSIG